MKVIPENNTVLCERVVEPKVKSEVDGIFCERDALPVYRIIDVAGADGVWKSGDLIVCDSTGTRLNIPEQGIRYLFKEENIVCKILNDYA